MSSSSIDNFTTTTNNNNNPPTLKRSLSNIDGAALIISSVIGSGIFASPGIVFKHVGSGGAALTIWFITGFLAYTGAQCYVELGMALPSAGAETTYLEKAFGPRAAFLFTWTQICIARPAGMAVMSIVAGQYVCRTVYSSTLTTTNTNTTTADECNSNTWSVFTFSIILALLCCVLNFSPKITALALNFTTTLSIISLTAIGVIGFVWAFVHPQNHDSNNNGFGMLTFHGTSIRMNDLSPAFFAALWSFDGFNSLNYSLEELLEPSKINRILNWSMPLITFCYIIVNAAFLVTLPAQDIANSGSLGYDFGRVVGGHFGGTLIAIIVACAAQGANIGNLYTGSRMVYSAARGGALPSFLSHVDSRDSPINAIFLITILALLFIFSGNVESLIGLFSSAVWLFYLLTTLGLIKLRMDKSVIHPYYASTISVGTFAISALIMLIGQVIAAPISSFVAFAFVGSGNLAYYVFLQRNHEIERFKSGEMSRRLSGGQLSDITTTVVDGTSKGLPLYGSV
jgi:amino acid transporter